MHGKEGKRTDSKNLISQAKSMDVEYVNDKKGLQSISATNIEKSPALGLFRPPHMSYDKDRIGAKNNNQPSLSDMSEKAISLLEANPNGYLKQCVLTMHSMIIVFIKQHKMDELLPKPLKES